MSDNIIVLDNISAAERRVLARVVQGESNKEIGLVLVILLALLAHAVTGHGEDQALKDRGASDLDQFDHEVTP